MDQQTTKGVGNPAAGKRRRRRAGDGVAQILKARKAIIDALIEHAKKGSYLHAKFLFDYARISQAEDPDSEREVSLAELLLEKLQIETDANREAETCGAEKAAVP